MKIEIMKQITILLLLFITPYAYAYAQDTTVPELISFEVSPQIVDITDGPGTVTVTMGATDDISGVQNINPSLYLPNGSNSNTGGSLISGTIQDGVWEATFTVPQYTETGIASINSISFFRDFAGNQTYIPASELIAAGYDIEIEIIDDNPSDVTVPELISLDVSPQIVDITDGPATVTVTLGATDDISGVSNINPSLYLPNGSNSNKGGSLISGTILDGVWEATFTVPQYTQTGTATINSVSFFKDFAGNQTYITAAELIAAGYDIEIEIIDDNPSDVSVPELVSFEISPQIVDITNGPGTVTVTLGATDDISGVSNINPTLYFPNGSNTNSGSSLISGTILDGVWEATFNIPQFTQTGTATINSISFFMDFAGNQTYITAADLIAAGYDNDFEIINTSLPVTWLHPLKIDDQNKLTWTISNQINNSHFEIEHSINGQFYKALDRIEGEGNTSKEVDYEYVHNHPDLGMNYYRIKQVDLDGKYSYSNVVFTNYKLIEPLIFPNPVSTNRLFVKSLIDDSMIIYNQLGQQIERCKLNKGLTEVNISALQNGIYVLKFESGYEDRLIKN